MSYSTVQSLCASYRDKGESGLLPAYCACGKKRRDARTDFVYRAVRCFKTWHPSWGAGKIRAEILLACPALGLPSIRSIERWFMYNGQNRRRKRPPQAEKQWAKSAHEVWQIDAKEELLSLDGQKNCWLNIKDEYTGAVIDPPVFPL